MRERGAIYIASTLSNANRVRQIGDVFREAGVRITYDWTSHGKLTDEDALRRAATGEVDGVRKADALVFITPAKVGSGIEFGLAWATRIPIFALLEEGPEIKPFYYLPGVTTYEDFQDLVRDVLDFLDDKYDCSSH